MKRLCRLGLVTHSLRSLEVVLADGFPQAGVFAALFSVAAKVAVLVSECANLDRLVLSGPEEFFARVAETLAISSPTGVARVDRRFAVDLPCVPFFPEPDLAVERRVDVLRIQSSQTVPNALSPDQLEHLLLLMMRTLAGRPPLCRRLVLGPGLKLVLAAATPESRREWAAAEQIAQHRQAALGFRIEFPPDLGTASLLGAGPTEQLQGAMTPFEELFVAGTAANAVAPEGP